MAKTLIVKASQIGCALDCVLLTGRTAAGGQPTDDTALLNDVLSMASASRPVKLILDGCALVTGLVLSPTGHTTLEGLGWDTGVFVKSGSGQDVVRLGPYTPAVPYTEGQQAGRIPSRDAANITLRDLALNGNASGNTNGSPEFASPPNVPIAGAVAHPVFGAIFTNCTNVHLDHVHFIDTPRYALTFANASGISISGCAFTSRQTFQDGIHIDGPCEDIRIADCTFSTGDDAIALNAPEGYAGDIADVVVDNCTFLDPLTVMRIYTSTKSEGTGRPQKVRQVVVSNCVGRSRTMCFNLGIEASQATSEVNQIEELQIVDCDLSGPNGLAILHTPMGSLEIRDTIFRAPTTGNPIVTTNTTSVGDLLLSGLTIVRNGDGHEAPPVLATYDGGGGVGRVTLDGIRVVDELGTQYPRLPYVLDASCSIGTVQIGSVDTSAFAAIIKTDVSWHRIAKIGGTGVLQTGAQIPDEVMADNVFFLSATPPHAGKLCVKIAGAVLVLAGQP